MVPTEIKDLCDSGPSQAIDDDFLDILSGRFTDTQETLTTKSLEPQIAQTNDISNSHFVSQVAEPAAAIDENNRAPAERNARKFVDSSDDEAEVSKTGHGRKTKKVKKRKQKVKRLGFSDDEDSSTAEKSDNSSIGHASGGEEAEDVLAEYDSEENEIEETLVDYDSEENEIEVKMKKKEIIKVANKYFEQEAELSESEWGSADEDEKGLDKYDIELGDEDHFDQNELQEEVGRIHARKVLDDDIKNVKKLEELLFENEENDGVGRNRKFRWANQKSFTLEDENARDGNAPEESDGEDESELLWRKMRHERETLLNEQSQKTAECDTMSDEVLFMDPNSQMVTTSSTSFMAKKKFKIIRSTSAVEGLIKSSDVATRNSPFLIKTASASKFQSSSFLSRDEQTLNRIAKFISHKDDEVTNLSHGSNSMSFLTIDKPDESKKRKSEGSKLQEASKKQKLETNSKQMLLDRLK